MTAVRAGVPVFALLILFGTAGPSAGQDGEGGATSRGQFDLSLFAGGSGFSGLQSISVTRPDIELEGQPFVGSIAPSAAATVGATGVYWLTNRWGVRIHANYASSRFEVRLPEGDRDVLEPEPGPVSRRLLGELTMWTYDLGAVARLPFHWNEISTYANLGLGAITYSAGDRFGDDAGGGLSRVFRGSSRTTQFAGALGVGVVVPLEELSLVFELSDLATPTPIDRDQEGELFRSSELVVELQPTTSEAEADRVSIVNSLRLMAGFTLTLGGS